LPWQLSELADLDFCVENRETTPGNKIRVYAGYIKLDNMKINGVNGIAIQLIKQNK
jgi:hypothetical protein